MRTYPTERSKALLPIEDNLWRKVGFHVPPEVGRHIPHLDLVAGIPQQYRTGRIALIDRIEQSRDLRAVPDIATLNLGNLYPPAFEFRDDVLDLERVANHVSSP